MPSAGSMAGDRMSGTVSMPPSAGAPDESGAVKGDRLDSRSDLSANGALYASDIFNRLVPTYGNYGGPGWTGGARGGDFKPPAIDIQDGFYKQHDEGYHDAASLDDVIAADRQLVASLDEYLKNGSYWDDPALHTNKDRILAAIYAEGASRVFQAKIAALMVSREDAQKSYDDARSAVGRSHFTNTMTFGNL